MKPTNCVPLMIRKALWLYGDDLDGRELRDYQSCIHEALLENQMPDEKRRGLMHWYDKQDGVNSKVHSVVFDVESRDGQLWCVAECKVANECCHTPGEVTQEQIDHAANGMVACPCCRRWSPFRCVEQTENTEENKIGMEMIPR